MLAFSYLGNDYAIIFRALASFLGTTVVENKIKVPDNFGKGIFELYELPMNIQLSLSDFTVKHDFYIVRRKSNFNYFNLRFDIIEGAEQAELLIDEQNIQQSVSVAYCFLTSTRFQMAYNSKKYTRAKTINLQFNTNTIKSLLKIEDTNELLELCVTSLSDIDKLIPATPEMISLINDLLKISDNAIHKKLKILSGAILLLDFFYSQIKQRQAAPQPVKKRIYKNDYKKMLEVENVLTKNLGEQPPNIEALAASVFMSTTKFKNIFKAIFGIGIYKYYQKARMEKAVELLQQGKTIPETALAVGYKNTANFIRTFKAAFNITPDKIQYQLTKAAV